ncbi:MAG: AMP-binding protein [bacterium]|nr:AMP-binding protein [bacterium]
MVKEQGIDGERSTVKAFIVGGEVLDTSLAGDIHEIFGGKTAIYNEYGPTETVVGCMIYKYDPGSDGRSSVPIGIPAANTGIYLLDNNRQPVPPGAGGELYISGHGVARGYINRPRLTTETFIDNPFEPGQTMYKSGDMARMLLDGNIEFLGRSDDQVKIRGFRIETGEIANRLTSHKDVKEAVVIQRERAGSQYLCAYIVPDAAGNPDLEAPPTVPEELKAYLAQELPDYMIPAFFVPIERIPLTPNGKINRHALPDPEIQVTESYEAPGNDIEEALTEIWREVLGLETVGINDNFFDIGGDSIKVIQIVSRLMRHKLHLEIKDLYSNPTIKQAAGFARPSDGTAEAEQGTITGNVKLTPIQNWFFKNHATNRHHYNQAVMIYRPEGFDEEYLHKIFEQIVHHHDALRMTYEINGARINQENRGFEEEPPDRLFDLEVFDLRHSTGVEAEIQQEAGRIQESIELDRGPLVKLGLFKTAEGDHLLIAVHHLVVDGVSWRILFEDFSILFGQLQKEEELKLPLKSTSFKEWAEKLSHYADSSALVQEIPYWRKIEQTHSPPLPKKSTALERKFKNYHTLSAQLSEEHTRMLLKDVNRAYNTEINDILLGALAAALKNWTGKTTALVDLEGHGRETIMDNVQIARTVGWFTSLFPVVLEMQDNHHTVDVIKNTKEMLRHIPNKGTGYGILKYLSADPRDLRFPLKPEISFNYLGKMDEDINTGIFRLSPFSPGDSADPEIEKTYSMDITGVIVEEKLNMSVKYHTGEFDEATISSFITGYMDALRQIIQHCRAAEGTEITESDMTASDFEEGEADSIFEELQEAFGN